MIALLAAVPWSRRCLLGVAVVATAATALAQEDPRSNGNDPPGWGVPYAAPSRSPVDGLVLIDNGLPNVLLTGYWPPTNEMLRQFSPKLAQNPSGWVGANWEGRGFNVYAFFPEFPGGTGSNPKGNGDFEVDYQDTSADWWTLLPTIRPLSIATFSRANTTNGWELEGGNRNVQASSWSSDYLVPTRPTSEMPSYNEVPLPNTRYTSLPVAQIIADVQASGANVNAFSTTLDTGLFLSNYIGYHGNWWRDLHNATTDPWYCVTGGHIHVGASTNLADAVLATEVTVRTLVTYVMDTAPQRGDADNDGDFDAADLPTVLAAITGPGNAPVMGDERFDFGRDDDIDMPDFCTLQEYFTGPGA